MNFKEFQEKTNQTALYPKEPAAVSMSYLTLGLCGESGEVAEIIKKMLRKGIPMSTLKEQAADNQLRMQIKEELGDVLWYIGQLCEQCELSMDDIAADNIKKLEQRSKANQIQKID
jgi:NTP pyrophosphatase (non-canonical NTP hydrolase)